MQETSEAFRMIRMLEVTELRIVLNFREEEELAK